ncbi:SDR family oxidoreductase [Streptomyces sp. NBC_00576]|uniref:SDR family oxidoreductase n=1 Tax=Streptomyces sp. NBC_00576 TaxID=2903665 RepID=UPI002E8022DD|nr:SDR family oxidoreductase [Streptomyces sp. NBC_00576]WUB73691.1 SDR family oxidoreductase [Streptomyces sp. NBC_00576]
MGTTSATMTTSTMRVVVVGASSGLGRCTGIDLSSRGNRVALLARRHDRLVDTAKEAGPDALAIACDVTDESSCRAAIEEAADGLGGIDALVYTTGIGPLAPVEKTDADTWRRIMDTNVIGAALVTNAALPHLTASAGTAVHLSTVGASITPAWPGFAGYHVSKAALEKLVEAYRVEHPSIGFTRFVVRDCGGGDSRTEFNNDWDMTYAAEVVPVWRQRGYLTGDLLDVSEFLRTLDAVLRCGGTIPEVTVTPRASTPQK